MASSQSYIEKWTAYSHISGVTKENQWIDIVKMDLSPNKVVIDGKISELVEKVVRFTDARKWGKYDTPRNLILGIISEVGELADLIQWEGDGVVEKSTGDRSGDDISSLETPQHHQINKVAQEIADICIYVLKLANALNIVEELEGALAKHKL
jgi:dCTP diphosphatase